ncbi:hypothetical protein K461DRAFT_319174 [Myriangium duriaei CBS 260.36]|uniref:Uncharacterized protein n=1 Tax=Myriangium duriaei CBS 260.36 TaxID=1168546 RepID=A0A9P4J389_9PEZI|nr:hypothetical protein K461DRAFT_319174 [Myriangium duriaei CBS 260.36]
MASSGPSPNDFPNPPHRPTMGSAPPVNAPSGTNTAGSTANTAHTTNAAHTDSAAHSGGNVGEQGAGALKDAWGKFHGAGEVLRGNLNGFVHGALGEHEKSAADRAVTDKGTEEFKTGKFNAHDAEPTTQSHPHGGL